MYCNGLLNDKIDKKSGDNSEAPSSERFILGLGSNCGDRVEKVASAIAWLSELLTDVSVSDIYETPAYGHAGSPYMNAVIMGYYSGRGGIEVLEHLCKEYEMANGRDAEARMNNLVPIDIDIVISGSRILRQADFSRGFFQKGYKQIIK